MEAYPAVQTEALRIDSAQETVSVPLSSSGKLPVRYLPIIADTALASPICERRAAESRRAAAAAGGGQLAVAGLGGGLARHSAAAAVQSRPSYGRFRHFDKPWGSCGVQHGRAWPWGGCAPTASRWAYTRLRDSQ